MKHTRTWARSPYMEFAKLHTSATYNLATSGVMNYPLSELPVRPQDLEINGPTVYGYSPLQERLAAKAGVPVECVVASTGTSMANHLAMAACFEPGDEVLIEEPTYELLLSTARYLGADIKRFSRRFEDGFRLDPEQVGKHITPRTRLVVITNLHNPSGVLASPESLRAVGEIAKKYGARVLVDEVYLELLFQKTTPSAYFLGDNFVVTSSLTKAYGLSGIRCGWIVAQPELAERMWKINDLYGATPVHLGELLSVIALDNLDKVRERARQLVQTNWKVLDQVLASQNEIEYVYPRYGTIIFPRLREGELDSFHKMLLEEFQTSVVPGRFFEMPQHFRIGLGGDVKMTADGLERLGKALHEFAGRPVLPS
jgi:aspartate/methionine/tyrosine aminotransferase